VYTSRRLDVSTSNGNSSRHGHHHRLGVHHYRSGIPRPYDGIVEVTGEDGNDWEEEYHNCTHCTGHGDDELSDSVALISHWLSSDVVLVVLVAESGEVLASDCDAVDYEHDDGDGKEEEHGVVVEEAGRAGGEAPRGNETSNGAYDVEDAEDEPEPCIIECHSMCNICKNELACIRI
jgi:hypothetical protein